MVYPPSKNGRKNILLNLMSESPINNHAVMELPISTVIPKPTYTQISATLFPPLIMSHPDILCVDLSLPVLSTNTEPTVS